MTREGGDQEGKSLACDSQGGGAPLIFKGMRRDRGGIKGQGDRGYGRRQVEYLEGDGWGGRRRHIFPLWKMIKRKESPRRWLGRRRGKVELPSPPLFFPHSPFFPRSPFLRLLFAFVWEQEEEGEERGLSPSIFAFFLSWRLCREWGGRGGGRLKLAERKRTKSSPFRFSHNGKWKEREWVGKRTFLTQNKVAKCQKESKTEQFLKVAPSP